jgi:hypothetical protein
VNRTALALALILVFGVVDGVRALELEPVWRTSGFAEPAAVVYDPERDLLYVANANRQATDDRAGFISKLALDGTTIERAWVTGLDGPSGLALHGGLLYAADVDRLVAIDVEQGTILEAYSASGAHTLGGIAADAGGRVYLADPATNVIFAFDHGSMRPWLTGSGLESPTALLAEEVGLVIATWGASSDALTTEVPGHLKRADYASKAIQNLGGSVPIGNLAGVRPWPDGGYLITDGSRGTLLHADPSGAIEPLLELGPGAGALEVVPEARLIVIPLRLDNQVAAYTWD